MAKKKTIDLRSVDPTPVPAGDVNIFYNGNRIAGFSEDTDAELKTGGTRVEHDIAVSYTKPTSNIEGVPIIFNNESSSQSLLYYTYGIGCVGYKKENGNYIGDPDNPEWEIPIQEGENLISWGISVEVSAESGDDYTVTVNGETATYNSNIPSYDYIYQGAVYPESITITVTDKEK